MLLHPKWSLVVEGVYLLALSLALGLLEIIFLIGSWGSLLHSYILVNYIHSVKKGKKLDWTFGRQAPKRLNATCCLLIKRMSERVMNTTFFWICPINMACFKYVFPKNVKKCCQRHICTFWWEVTMFPQKNQKLTFSCKSPMYAQNHWKYMYFTAI